MSREARDDKECAKLYEYSMETAGLLRVKM